MKVLVLGGTRFIGPRVVEALVSQGHDVTVLHRGEHEHPQISDEVEHLHGDMKDDAFLNDAAKREPEAVVHMLAMSGDHMSSVMNAFSGRAGRMITISSLDVYLAYDIFRGVEAGPVVEVPLSEEALLRRARFPYRADAPDENHMMYSYDKIPVEEATLSYPDLPGTVLRLPAIHGPDDGQHRFLQYVKRMVDKRPFIFIDEMGKDWRFTRSYVEDTAHAIALATISEDAQGQTFNVGEQPAMSDVDWIPLLAEATGWTGEVLIRSSEGLPEKLRAPDLRFDQHLEVDTSKIRSQLGFKEIVPREEGIAKTVEWEASTPDDAYDLAGFDYAAEDAAV